MHAVPPSRRRRTAGPGAPRRTWSAAALLLAGCAELAAPEPPGVEPPAAEPPAATVSYDAVTLGTMGGRMSNAWAVNTAGLVAGWSDAAGGRGFRWTESSGMTDLIATPGGTRGINEAGAITGYYNLPAGGQRGYVVDDVARRDLPPLAPGQSTVGYAINAAGTVAGASGGWIVAWTRAADGSYGSPVPLGPRTGAGSAAVNAAGDVAFTASMEGRASPVLRRRQADGSYGDPIVLGRPAGGHHEALGLNDAGVVVGFRWTGFIEVAVLWHPSDYDTPIDLGDGQAWAINAAGQVVGVTGGELPVFGGAPRRAALWTVDAERRIAGPIDLGTPAGYASAGARAISAGGWIVGSSWGPGADVVATLWRPAR